MVPNQDYREDGKQLPVPSVTEVHCGARNVWPGIIVQQQHPL
jgi:hypothetical protein